MGMGAFALACACKLAYACGHTHRAYVEAGMVALIRSIAAMAANNLNLHGVHASSNLVHGLHGAGVCLAAAQPASNAMHFT